VKVIYMTHPLSAPTPEGIKANIARAKRWYKWIIDHYDVAVVADCILCCEVWEDASPQHRDVGLAMDFNMVARCDEIWHVGGKISSGAASEGAVAELLHKRRLDLTHLGAEPPAAHPDWLIEFDEIKLRRWAQ